MLKTRRSRERGGPSHAPLDLNTHAGKDLDRDLLKSPDYAIVPPRFILPKSSLAQHTKQERLVTPRDSSESNGSSEGSVCSAEGIVDIGGSLSARTHKLSLAEYEYMEDGPPTPPRHNSTGDEINEKVNSNDRKNTGTILRESAFAPAAPPRLSLMRVDDINAGNFPPGMESMTGIV